MRNQRQYWNSLKSNYGDEKLTEKIKKQENAEKIIGRAQRDQRRYEDEGPYYTLSEKFIFDLLGL
jgi:hypothetical protein